MSAVGQFEFDVREAIASARAEGVGFVTDGHEEVVIEAYDTGLEVVPAGLTGGPLLDRVAIAVARRPQQMAAGGRWSWDVW